MRRIIFLVKIDAIVVSGKKSFTNNNVKNTRIKKFKIVESFMLYLLSCQNPFYCNMVLLDGNEFMLYGREFYV
jgi:hypothetical protein